ncbi:hypothetical protein ATCC90586_005807 [Pythium insidiosum]|nr:hypothetical protein ATCC90586_005807 [Pythium insidiosum]
MCACVSPPPFMLGDRPTPSHGGTGAATFRQVPFVRVSERAESGLKVRKQLRKYLQASASTQQMVAQMHLNDACVTAMQPQEVAQSCFEECFAQLKLYNQVVGQKHLEASKALQEMARPLEHSGKARKWLRDSYNLVQRCVQDVGLAEKKMEKARLRKERGDEDLAHWKRVLEANEATYQVQPNSPEVQRAFQLAQYRFASAFGEVEAATQEFEDAVAMLHASIERRDQVVEESTELAQAMEEDRLETMLIVLRQFVETKKAILQAEIEALGNMQRVLLDMDRESVIQQYIVDAMQPDVTHRQAKALSLLEWQRLWHLEQLHQASHEPSNLLALTTDDAARLKRNGGVSGNDVEVIKDFVLSCFLEPDWSIMASASTPGKPAVSSKHRGRFTDLGSAGAMYRLPIVRKTMLAVLHHQRTQSLELTGDGFDQLTAALGLLLDASSEQDDARTIKGVMNLAQTFFRGRRHARNAQDAASSGAADEKEFLVAALLSHEAWNIPQFWGNALLISIGEELSKTPQTTPWYFLPATERSQLVLHVHNMVFGQATSFLYNLQAFGYSRRQIIQYANNVSFAYELGEEQRMALLSSVDALPWDESHGGNPDLEAKPRATTAGEPSASNEMHRLTTLDSLEDDKAARRDAQGEIVQFTSMSMADWSYLTSSAATAGGKLRPFRQRTMSSSSDNSSASTLTPRSTLDSYVVAVGMSGSKQPGFIAGSLSSLPPSVVASLTSSTASATASIASTSASTATAATAQQVAAPSPLPGPGAAIKDLEAMKLRASELINNSVTTQQLQLRQEQEAWQDLFGSAPDTSSSDGGDDDRPKRVKARKSTRKFNEQLRLARGQSLGERLHGGDDGVACSDASSSHHHGAASVPSTLPGSTVATAAATGHPEMTGPVVVTPPFPVTERAFIKPRDSRERQASTDDTSIGLHSPSSDSSSQRSRRLTKARSAASIDTTGVLAAAGETGMDQIKSIAAQMQQRRELLAKGASSPALDAHDAPGRLRKTQSIATISVSSPSAEPGAAAEAEAEADAAAQATPSSGLSGVAALRARFEKKG